MANQQLVDYIQKARESGQTDDQIKDTLYKSNWTEPDINEAFAMVNPLPQQTPIQPKYDPQSQPIQKNMNPSRSVASGSKSKTFLIGLVALLIAVVGNYFYWQIKTGNFTISLAVTGFFVVTGLISLLIVWLFAAIFKVPDNHFSKALLFVGAGGVLVLLTELAVLLPLPGFLSGLIALLIFVISVVVTIILLIKIYSISVGKAIGLYICSGIVTAIISGIILMVLLFAGLFSLASFFSHNIKIATPVSQNTPSQTTVPTTQQTTPNASTGNTLTNFTCPNIKNVTYSPKLLQGQTLFVGWGSQFDSADTNTWGSYGSIDSSGNWSGFTTSTGEFRQGTNSSLMPLTISALTSGSQHNYQAAVMTIICSDSQTVNAYIPAFKDGFAAQEIDGSGNTFYSIYVANNGSTYYDSALTKLARASSGQGVVPSVTKPKTTQTPTSTASSIQSTTSNTSITQPSITVTSPNGGEIWSAGEIHTITWNASAYSSTSNVQIFLYDLRGATLSIILANTKNSGSYSWKIPSTIAGDELNGGNVYKIAIFIGPSSDTSDSNFSIVDSTTTNASSTSSNTTTQTSTPTITSLSTSRTWVGNQVFAYVSNLPMNSSYTYEIVFNGPIAGGVNATLSSDGSHLVFNVPNFPAGDYQINAFVVGPATSSNSVPFTIYTP